MSPVAWLGFVVLAEALILLLFVPNERLRNVVAEENAMRALVFSGDSIRRIDERVQAWYRKLITDPGVDRALYTAVTPSHRSESMQRMREKAKGSVTLDDRGFFKYMRERVDALLFLIYTVLQRIAVAVSWAPFALIVLIPSLIDGALRWRIRRHGYAYQSPVMHNFAWRMKSAILLLSLFILPLPVALPPVTWPTLFAGVAIALSTSVAFLPKRI